MRGPGGCRAPEARRDIGGPRRLADAPPRMKPGVRGADTGLMPEKLEIALVAAHALGLCLLPLLAAAYVHVRARRALAEGADSAAVFFTSVQWLAYVPGATLVALVVSAGSPAELALRRGFEAVAGPVGPLLLFPFAMLPLACAVVATALVAHGITARTRGGDVTLRESLRQAAWLLVMIGAGLAGLLGLQACFGFGAIGPGLACVAAGLAGAAAAQARWAASLGLAPHAVTHGPLRDRLFALAAKAGVTLQQLYVLPMRRHRMANAFAVQGGVVLLSDWLLENLERREVDAVLAHELAHIRLRHPRKLAIAAAAGVVAGAALVVVAGFATSIVAGVVLSLLVARFVSRRCEFEADALAVRLTGDAEALVTALVRIGRLNHVPVHWGRAAESGLTHPSTLRRIEALARAAGIPADRLRELLARDEPPRERDTVPAPAAPGGKVFSSEFKRRSAGALSWLLLGVTLAMAAAGVGAVRLLELPRPLAPLAGALVALAALVAANDLLAARGQARLRRPLAERLGPADGERFVGLSPGEATRVYEGYFDWDLGFLALEAGALAYRGEETSFRLPRAAIAGVRQAGGPPGWLPAPRVAIEWHDATTGARGVVHLRPAHSPRLDALAHDTAELLREIARWRAGCAAAPDGRTLPPPREDEVTGTPLARVAHPSTLVPAALLAVPASALLAAACGLPIWPFGGAGAFDVWAATVGALALVRVPGWRAREVREEPRAAERRAA